MMVACYQRPANILADICRSRANTRFAIFSIVVQAPARRLARPFGSNDVRHSRYHEILIETSIVTNAALMAFTVQQESNGACLETDETDGM
jgi:hypothetical protein